MEKDLFYQFYKQSLPQRQAALSHYSQSPAWMDAKGLDLDLADHLIENAVAIYGLPLGIVPHVQVDGKDYIVPLVTEEPSVIAAASNAAKLLGQAGGVKTQIDSRLMLGHVSFYQVGKAFEDIQVQLATYKDCLLDLANQAYPSIVKRGGGARDIWVKQEGPFVSFYLSVDTQEAMGANMVNTMLEALVENLGQLCQGQVLMAILTNLADQSLVTATCSIPYHLLAKDPEQANLIRDKIILASSLASHNPYRAATHNKGIMNGIDGLVMATGNDWRAVEAGAHSYASLHHSQVQPLATWTLGDKGQLEGRITLPLAIGTVGGSIAIHPHAQMAHQLLGNPTAKELASLMAAIGLGQNLAALKALVSDGIQKGHMRMQARSLAVSVGAKDEEVANLVALLLPHKNRNSELAKELLDQMRKK